MKDIKFIKTTQIMIFPSDDIDFYGINNDETLQVIISKYQLSKVTIPAQFSVPLPQILLQNGSFRQKQSKFIIEQLIIEERKIVINILSDSTTSNAFYSDLRTLLIALDLRKSKGSYEPLVSTYETTCILKLNFKFGQLCPRIPITKLENKISENVTYSSSVSIIPSSLRFQISYDKIPEKLLKNKISISDKHFVIELREKTDPDDQLYFTASPTDTETHFELIKILEDTLS